MELLKNVKITTFSIFAGIYVIALGIIYYFIFHKHHKRNNIGMDELISLVSSFYTRTIISTLLIFGGIYCFILANVYKEERSDVIALLLLGIITISITIISYINYIKRALKDPNSEIRESNRKATIRVGEILEFIIFTIFIFMPIWCIPYFVSLASIKEILIKELIKVFAISFASLFLLFALNPLDIKGKLNKTEKQKKEKKMEEKKKSKKILKVLLIAILVILLIIVAIKAYSIKILFNISDAINSYKEGDFAYKVKETSLEENYNNGNHVFELIKKDNIYVFKMQDEKETYIDWYDLDSKNEYYNHCNYYINSKYMNTLTYSNENLNEIKNTIKANPMVQIDFSNINLGLNDIENKSFIEKCKKILSLPIVHTEKYDGKECYVYEFYAFKYYVDKELLLPIVEEFRYQNKLYSITNVEYNFTYDEKILEEPNMNEFDIVEYYDDDITKEATYVNEYSEKSISGTTLDPKEVLVENVELLENENLDVFKLKENSFGIKTVRINYLDTYNKLRKNYSNLRELTEEDFKYYYVLIAYKKGYELTYSTSIESSQTFIINYVFNEKPTDKENLVLMVVPRAEKNSINAIINSGEIKATSQKSYETYFANEDLIKENVGINKDIELGWGIDLLVKLTNEDYEKLNFVNTKIENEEEPVCWLIYNTTFELKTSEIKTYINATTGELIGSTYTKW